MLEKFSKYDRGVRKFKNLRELASEISNTTVEDANTYTILNLCDQLVDAIDAYMEDQEDKNED